MTGSSSGDPAFSGLTLALLEDSGWYHVNYSAADPLAWGLGQGCDFVNKSCASWSADLGYVWIVWGECVKRCGVCVVPC
jgi:hypothetical protein